MSARLRSAALVVVGFGAAPPAVVAADPVDPCAGTSIVDGVVVDRDGHGVANAAVAIEPADRSSVLLQTTASDGSFRVACVPPGDSYVQATTRELAARPQELALRPGDATRVRLVMIATVVAGLVVTADGAPAATAELWLRGPLDTRDDLREAITVDDHGRFARRGILPGRYRLEARLGELAVDVIAATTDGHVVIALPRHPRS
nr:carboxypeptidase-like regulatory domain-containing protein [Kofleriaceae bacterium]